MFITRQEACRQFKCLSTSVVKIIMNLIALVLIFSSEQHNVSQILNEFWSL